jgi:hypothetical protein
VITVPNVAARSRAISTPAYRDGLREMICSHDPTHFVTLAFNRDIQLEPAEKALRAFHARLDRAVLGPRLLNSGVKRSKYIALAENVDTNFHFHAAFIIAPDSSSAYVHTMPGIWEKLMPGGSIDVQQVTFAGGLAGYITKQITPSSSERLIISEGFS